MEQDVHAPATDAARRSTRAARRSPASTSTSSSAAGATTRGARPRRARTSSTRSRSTLCEPTARSRPRTRRTTASAAACLPIEVLETHEPLEPDARPTDTPAGTQTLRARAHEARARHRPRRRSAASPSLFTQAALDLLPRDRLGAPASRTSTTRTRSRDAGDLPARGVQDRLHVQLVLRRRRAHRVLQLGRQPGARRRRRPRLPGARRELRVARLQPGRLARRAYTPFAKHPQA